VVRIVASTNQLTFTVNPDRAPLVSAIFNSVWCFFIFYRLYRLVTAKRILHRSLCRVENFTVLLREIPEMLAGEIGDHVDALLENNKVVSVVVALKSRKLPIGKMLFEM
jgi:hypothetical protein